MAAVSSGAGPATHVSEDQERVAQQPSCSSAVQAQGKAEDEQREAAGGLAQPEEWRRCCAHRWTVVRSPSLLARGCPVEICARRDVGAVQVAHDLLHWGRKTAPTRLPLSWTSPAESLNRSAACEMSSEDRVQQARPDTRQLGE